MHDNLFRSHSLEKSSSDGKVVTSGAITLWEDNPVSPLNVGDTFQPVPDGPTLTVNRVNINDNVIGINAGKTVRQWQISIEGSDQSDSSSYDNSERHTFSIEQDNDNVIHSGTISRSTVGNNPPSSIAVGSIINIPGIGSIKCSKISGSDDFNDNGQRVWNITYEGSDATDVSDDDEQLPNVKYSFSIENEHSGSMQVVNEGNSPNVTLNIGDSFNIPGIGNVKCTKVYGNDDYSNSGSRRWTVTYEGSDATQSQSSSSDTRYSFSVDHHSGVRSGSLQVTYYGNSPSFAYGEGDSFILPCVGSVTCSKASGSDEFLDDGRHKWTLTYEGSSGGSIDDSNTKYSLAIEKDSDGVLQRSGSMAVVSLGETPTLNISVGDTFNIPGIGYVTCSKVSGSDAFDEFGNHKWTITYEGYTSGQEQHGGDSGSDDTSHSKYSFAITPTSQSGSVEVSSIGDTPPSTYNIGSEITLPGIDKKLSCVKVSGSDSYTENGNRKWTVVFEASDELQTASASDIKYSFSTEKNSDGVSITTGSKQFYVQSSGSEPLPGVEIGDPFYIPIAGRLICTKVSGSDDGTGLWSFTIEGQRGGSDTSGSDDDDDDDEGLPDNELSTSYEINGSTVRTVDGKLLCLRRSTSPIVHKTFTLYSKNESSGLTPGNEFEGGIILSINTICETLKNNGVTVSTYYKHSIEVEA